MSQEPDAKRDHQARVHVDDELWKEFRRYAPGPVGAVLGELVEREVRRYRQRQLREGSLDDMRLPELLDDARALKDSLAAVIDRLERYEARPTPPQPTPGVWRW